MAFELTIRELEITSHPVLTTQTRDQIQMELGIINPRVILLYTLMLDPEMKTIPQGIIIRDQLRLEAKAALFEYTSLILLQHAAIRQHPLTMVITTADPTTEVVPVAVDRVEDVNLFSKK